jgi:hypothetical protein
MPTQTAAACSAHWNVLRLGSAPEGPMAAPDLQRPERMSIGRGRSLLCSVTCVPVMALALPPDRHLYR